jgi:exodeoxyribonuclease VII small subunit
LHGRLNPEKKPESAGEKAILFPSASPFQATEVLSFDNLPTFRRFHPMLQSPAEKDAKESFVSSAPFDLKFETALAEIERIVQDMESGSLPLEESITAYRRGSELLRHCQKQLGEAERRIRVFENDELRDMEPDGESGR